jgi:hypothetical protein
MLQLSATLDLLAKIVGRQFGLDIPSNEFAWTNRKFRAALRAARPKLPGEVLSLVMTTAQLLALIRNRIHAGPLAPVADDDTVWFAPASEDQADFESRARQLGGAVAWGLVENRGLPGRLLDPWKLVKRASGDSSRPPYSCQTQRRVVSQYDGFGTGLALGSGHC